MASLYILKNLSTKVFPKLFKPAIINTEIIIGSCSKLYIEHNLLFLEGMFLSSGLGILGTTINSNILLSLSALSFVITVPGSYALPAYRTLKCYHDDTLQIINIEK